MIQFDYGKIIKECRTKRRWSQYDLAEIAGVTQTTISSIETGKTHRINEETRRKLAKAFKITVEKLFPSPDDILIVTRIQLQNSLVEYFKRTRELLNLDSLKDRDSLIQFLIERNRYAVK